MGALESGVLWGVCCIYVILRHSLMGVRPKCAWGPQPFPRPRRCRRILALMPGPSGRYWRAAPLVPSGAQSIDWVPPWLQPGLQMTIVSVYWDELCDAWCAMTRVTIPHPRSEQPTVFLVYWMYDSSVVMPEAAPAA